MSDDQKEFSSISSLVDELVATQANNKQTELSDVLLSKLYTELQSLEDYSHISSILDELESCFIKLTRLFPVSSSPLLITSCIIIFTQLNEAEFFSENIEHNRSKSDEYYTLAMDALNTKINLNYLQGHESFALDLHDTYTQSFLTLAREIVRSRNRSTESLSVQQWNSRTSSFESKYQSFLKILLAFIDKHFSTGEDLESHLYFFVSLADDTNLVPILIECEIVQYLKTWLVTLNNNKSFENSFLCEPILFLTNNVARHEEGSNALKNVQMNQALDNFWECYGHTLSTNGKATYYMAYALIVTPDELKSATVLHHVIDYLLSNINIASQSTSMRTDTAHMSEYLIALARLVVNDNVAQYIIKTSKIGITTDGLTFFNTLFQKYNDLTPNDLYLKHLSRIALFNIFSSFSYQTTAQQSLASNTKFIEVIKKASRYNNEQDVIIQPYLLQHLSSTKQAAEAILINLDLYKDEDAVRKDVPSKTTHQYVMISYSHKDVLFCRDLIRALRSHSIDLWVDEDGHCRSDDCWEEIAMAIKHASFILVIVSPSYCQSVSCRKEATYADKRKKTLIALYPNNDKYEPDEWLDIRLTGTYVRFGGSDKEAFDGRIARLLEYIRPKEGNATNLTAPKKTSSVPPPLSTPAIKQSDDVSINKIQPIEIAPLKSTQSLTITKPSIHDWTKQDVQTWFLIERNLLPELYKLYSFVDGDSLLEYARHFTGEHERDANQQYEKLHKRLHNESGIEFYDNNYTDLVCSMKKILLTYDRPRPSITKNMSKGSSTCLIL